ncbi:DUF4998 domain-containing protein [Thalassobellus suaedae]|uniref:DUF4998 domain-containing protein n=1 Tax=Thalassobellus suaedae TaxID=3074124 RepID=A0ABY9XY48_9FLAO|nr:DUF4998 domain-containing protein [Flavobacteriaceae bacterium HL-DH14]
MKNKIKYIIIGILTLGFFACQDQTDIYDEFVKNFSDKNYPGKVLDPISYSGKNRIQLNVLTPGDPAVKELRVFWNFFTDSVSVPITETNKQMEILLNNMPENSYSFVVKTYDGAGNISVPVEVFGTSYGIDYEKIITNRDLIDVTIDDITGKLTLEFGDADISNGAIETLISYTNSSDIEKTVTITVDEDSIIITDYKSGGQFYTVFLPDATSIDTFSTSFDNIFK